MEQTNLFYQIYKDDFCKTEDLCDKEPCTKLNILDFILAYSNQEPSICITYPENDSITNLSNPCANFTLYHKIFEIMEDKTDVETTIYQQTFYDVPKRLFCCADFDYDLILNKFMEKFKNNMTKLEENIFYLDKEEDQRLKYEYDSRYFLEVKGLGR